MEERLTTRTLAEAFDVLLDLPERDRAPWVAAHGFHPLDSARLRRMLEADRNANARFLDAPAFVHVQVLDEGHAHAVDPHDVLEKRLDESRLE